MYRPLRCALIIDGHQASVQRALGRRDLWTRTFRVLGLREVGGLPADDPRARLEAGEHITFRADRPGARPRIATLRVTAVAGGDAEPPEMEVVMGAVRARLTVVTKETGGGCLATFDALLSVPRPLLALARRRFVHFGETLLSIATLAAHDPQVVVAGAVINEGRVLAARRTRPAELAGQWEMPGGKVEPGEGEREALHRELREELGIEVQIGERIGPSCDVGEGRELRPYLAQLVSGLPTPMEADPAHDEVRWLAVTEFEDINWLPSDLPFVKAIHGHLTAMANESTA